MNKMRATVDGIKTGMGIVLLGVLMGCVGYVDEGYVGPVIMPWPDAFYFGGV